ncbi:type I restriction-modification enzyme R subunit C-terminal domain-containing protein [Desulfovermiculus halophilus]|uniref:type I restriction endonuclease subunit R n=1 Tax=Desulfovermiculus halophilus TaxID=339722 RepID=UPI00048293D1|nr:DEAD/DEAH box helicase family protein [Desulfovermiculus halophilus]
MNKTPEQEARDSIDELLEKSGWVVVNKKAINWSLGPGLAVREYQTDAGPADYVLFVDRKPVGVIEAKRKDEGHRLSSHEGQAEAYAKSKIKWFADSHPLPFVYESTGLVTQFTDLRDPKPRAREVFSFHHPATLSQRISRQLSLCQRLQQLPDLPPEGLRDCQLRAIANLEESFKQGRPRALIQMATGSGKTFTAITSIYRLLKYADAQRILFLVDTKNLGEQAEQEFMAYTPLDDNRKFIELYNVRRLNSRYVPQDSQVCISTIQRMYSILKGEDMDEAAEQSNPHEHATTGQPKEVEYNPDVPPEFFDFIIIDECHRSIYNLWRQVLDYFDAFHIGLTATPDKRTFAFFNENVVSEYRHEEAVADGVNVGYDTYLIETEITKQGSKLFADLWVDKRDRLTRRMRWDQLDEDVTYRGNDLDRDVVNPSQIRNVIKTFRDKLPEIFPVREEVPKTLIFAKTDSHADDIIKIVREEFAEENAFCKKVTYKASEDPKSMLTSFRNDYYPRIAVTVDMIATGTDVKPLECLLFMRDVRSKNYFEQMKGRGTRTLSYDDLKKVTPSTQTNKTGFVIVDAVGVSKSLKTDSRPLERKKSVPLKDLLQAALMGHCDEDTYTSLANRLAKLEQQITPQEREKFKELTGGKSINTLVHNLLDAHNPDKIIDAAKEKFSLPADTDPDETQKQEAQKDLIDEARNTFTGELNEYIEKVRTSHEQIIDNINLDHLEHAGWDYEAQGKASEIIEDFKAFLEAHKNEITALSIFYNQPYNRRQITYDMIKQVLETLKQNKPYLAPVRVWQAYEQLEKVNGKSPKSELTALVSLIRRVTDIDHTLTPYDQTVNRNFKKWVFDKQAGAAQKFDEEQMTWLRMIRDHIVSSIHMDVEDLQYAPFDGMGGAGKMAQLFGDEISSIIDEMNEALAA